MRRLMLVCLLGACGGGTKAYIPVDSPLRTWSAPEADAYTPEPAAGAKPAAPAPPAPAVAPMKEAKETKDKKAEKRP